MPSKKPYQGRTPAPLRGGGLYDPSFEHDGCGVGFVANLNQERTHGVLSNALIVLDNLVHRGAIGGDRATQKRLLEAKEVRTILEEPQFGGNPYIDQDMVLCGDMNDDPDSKVIEVLTRSRGISAKSSSMSSRELMETPTRPTSPSAIGWSAS